MINACNMCEIVARPTNLVFETDSWQVMLAKDQGYLGRAYVTLKTHKEHLSKLSQKEWQEYGNIVKIMENAWGKAFHANNFNWSCLMNDAYQKTPSKPHIHWHFRPRYSSKQKVNNIVFSDPHFTHHYSREQHSYVDEDTLTQITIKLTKLIRII